MSSIYQKIVFQKLGCLEHELNISLKNLIGLKEEQLTQKHDSKSIIQASTKTHTKTPKIYAKIPYMRGLSE